MDLTVKEVFRGNGKIFIRLPLPQNINYPRVNCSISAGRTDDIPRIIKYRKLYNDVIIITPITAFRQNILLKVFSDGALAGTFSYKLNPLQAKLFSQINTLIKLDDTHHVRNIDVYHVKDTYIKFEGIYPVSESLFSYRFTITSFFDASEINKKFSIRVFNSTTCTFVNESDVYIFDPLYFKQEDGSCKKVQTIAVTSQTSSSLYCVWVSSESSELTGAIYNLQSWEIALNREKMKNIDDYAAFDPRYESWFLQQHRVTAAQQKAQESYRFSREMLFSFIVPLYKTPLNFLHDMVESVLGQTYHNFELILINASPEDHELSEAINKLLDRDNRIKLITLDNNLGITLNTNFGIEEAQGDFLCFLDHDDTIEPNLLFEYMMAIEQNPQVDLLYCDEDKLLNNHYVDPFFKPDYNQDLLLAENYVTHLLCTRADVVRKLSIPTKEYDGAQDFNLTLKVAEQARCVCHIPKILYHWRIHDLSTAKTPLAKSYTGLAGKLAIEDALKRRNIQASVIESDYGPNVFNLAFQISQEPRVCIFVLYDDLMRGNKLEERGRIDRCIFYLTRNTNYSNFEIKLVSYRDYHMGFGDIVADYFVFIDSTVEVIHKNWLNDLIGTALEQNVVLVGTKLHAPDGLISQAGLSFHFGSLVTLGSLCPKQYGIANARFHVGQDISAVSSDLFLVEKDFFIQQEFLISEINYGFLGPVLSLLAHRNNLRVIYRPESSAVIHKSFESFSKTHEAQKLAELLMACPVISDQVLHYAVAGDPYMNPHIYGSRLSLNCSYMTH